ncbi:putative capsid protein [Dipodfec virus UA23Rod_1661]|uniref:Capsid protein n=1 Tax=Dipodfec virus UA23Rod_1661 TaxID=2929254 RepID=A0A976R7T2_9VIRU|nr:putative capsid protein [Dipodfec virus UA23Rod_1661]
MSSRIRRASRNYRNYYVAKKEKYQYVPFSVRGAINNINGVTQIICPPNTVSGMRKIKNINFEVTCDSADPIIYAVFYVPEGGQMEQILPRINFTEAQGVTSPRPFVELFAANQWVIGCGTCIQGSISRFRSRMARNLNNGDFIGILVFTNDMENPTNSIDFNITGNYAIKYN